MRWFIELVETYLDMKISRGPKGKSSFVTSSEQSKIALLGPMAALCVPPSTSVKWLGVDYGGDGQSKLRPKGKKARSARFSVIKSRWLKAGRLKRQRVVVAKVVDQGFVPALGYGATCHGTPPAILDFIAKKVSISRRGAGRFRSAVLGDNLLKHNPLHSFVLAPLRAWAKEWWDHPSWRDRMSLAFRKRIPQLQSAADSGVVEPATATFATVRDLGWEMPAPSTINTTAGGLDLNAVCPSTVIQTAVRSIRRIQLRKWVQKHGLEEQFGDATPWALPARHLTTRKKAKAWTRHHAAIV